MCCVFSFSRCFTILFEKNFLAVPLHVWDLSFLTRHPNHAPALGAWRLNCRITKEAPLSLILCWNVCHDKKGDQDGREVPGTRDDGMGKAE